ncbi:MAG TPA: GNAT family N-acetyltransferase [Jatrophihabitans sp.]|uniref:GNAT family N-acetyltransferase n=1 Tax=Jatrophihabitans sp. TaxID=1932789 RepID=UPI002DF9F1A7|nr:GNAT family N-acetyltransferase [Jatrophihabitans sp.]
MIESARGLNDAALTAIADLERRVVAADGGRLKLEWGTLRSRRPDEVNDLLWWDGDRLLGFLGLYAFGGPPNVEFGGMVDPDSRRQGIGTALLDEAMSLVRSRGFTNRLLVAPATTPASAAFARARGGVLDHSEHAMVQREPVDGDDDPRVTSRLLEVDDLDFLRHALKAGFGFDVPDLGNRISSDDANTVIIEFEGERVGTVRVSLEGDVGGVYGFVVVPEWQGQGIGRTVLRRMCRQLRADGAREVRLEVAVDNPNALRLYTSQGFAQDAAEDYYRL